MGDGRDLYESFKESRCDFCGGVIFFDAEPGAELRGYCRKCNPPKVKVSPVDEETNPCDVSENLDNLHLWGSPVSPADFNNLTCSSLPNANAGPADLNNGSGSRVNSGQVVTSDGTNDAALNINANGVSILTVYEDLPETAVEGAIVYLEGESAAYVFDGLDWQNLGKVARSISGRDAKCDRRAAIAATKAKNG